jgi:hypothetical protein
VVEGGTGVGEELAGGLGVGRLGMLGECCLDSGHGRGESAAVELADRTVVGLEASSRASAQIAIKFAVPRSRK